MNRLGKLQKADVMWAAAIGLLVLLQFWWLPGKQPSASDSFSNAIEGKLGLYRILSRLLPNVRRESDNLLPATARTIVLIGPDRYPNDREKPQLARFVRSGGTLVFAPNWSNPDFDFPAVWLQTESRISDGDDETGPIDADAGRSQDQRRDSQSGKDDPTPPVELPGFWQPEKFLVTSPLLEGSVLWRTNAALRISDRVSAETLVQGTGESVEVAGWPVGNGYVLACSSADAFSNRSMLDELSAELAVRLIDYADQQSTLQMEFGEGFEIVINESLNASEAYRYTGILFSPALRSGTLQLMLVALLCAWFGFHRFGPARRIESPHRKNLTASAEAVGNLQYVSPDGGRVVGRYMEYIDSYLRRTYGHTVRLDAHDIIAMRTGLPLDEVRTALNHARRMVGADRVSSAQAARTIRWLARLHRNLQRTD